MYVYTFICTPVPMFAALLGGKQLLSKEEEKKTLSTLNTLLSRPLVRFHRPWRGLSDSLLDAEIRAGLVTALVLGTKPQVTKPRFPLDAKDPIRFISSLTV